MWARRTVLLIGVLIASCSNGDEAEHEARRENPEPAWVLTAASLGGLVLDTTTVVSVERMQRLFPELTFERAGWGGGDAVAELVVRAMDADGEAVFVLWSGQTWEGAPATDQEFALRGVTIESPAIPDAWGIRVGSTYADVIRRRGDQLEMSAAHHDVVLGADGVFYNLPVPPPEPNQPDRSPESISRAALETEAGWIVSRISWPRGRW